MFCGVVGGSGALPWWCQEHGRAAWDLMAVLLAVRGPEDHYSIQPGFNQINPTGTGQNTWQPGVSHDGSQHFQAVLPDRHRRAVGRELDELLVRTPTRHVSRAAL